jgi:hypothetical protein
LIYCTEHGTVTESMIPYSAFIPAVTVSWAYMDAHGLLSDIHEPVQVSTLPVSPSAVQVSYSGFPLRFPYST